MIIVEEETQTRIDSYLATKLDISRSKIQKLIKEGKVLVNDKLISANYLVKLNDQNAMDAITLFACDNYPYTDFKDDYFREVFYQLNDIGFSISKKIAACDENAETD